MKRPRFRLLIATSLRIYSSVNETLPLRRMLPVLAIFVIAALRWLRFPDLPGGNVSTCRCTRLADK